MVKIVQSHSEKKLSITVHVSKQYDMDTQKTDPGIRVSLISVLKPWQVKLLIQGLFKNTRPTCIDFPRSLTLMMILQDPKSSTHNTSSFFLRLPPIFVKHMDMSSAVSEIRLLLLAFLFLSWLCVFYSMLECTDFNVKSHPPQDINI